MNYASHYERLIERARDRVLTGYCERHHVLPRCLGGGNEPSNIAKLTAAEHYIAHQLLVKMHPTHKGLIYAAIRMAKGCTGNKSYEWLRRRFGLALRGNRHCVGRIFSAETRAKIARAHLGMKRSPEAIFKTASANRGKKYGPLSPERVAKISAAKMGKKQTPEQIEKAAAPKRGRPLSDAHRKSISATKKGRPLSPQNRASLSVAQFRRWARVRALKEVDVS